MTGELTIKVRTSCRRPSSKGYSPSISLSGKEKGGNLYWHLRCQKKRSRLYGSGKRIIISNRVSRDDRPDSVDLKIRIGDWEVDMVVTDRENKEVVFTLVEVRSGFILISKLPGVNRIAPHRKSLIC